MHLVLQPVSSATIQPRLVVLTLSFFKCRAGGSRQSDWLCALLFTRRILPHPLSRSSLLISLVRFIAIRLVLHLRVQLGVGCPKL